MAVATQGHATTYDEIVTNRRDLTDAQFDEYKKGILDKKVEWEGTVFNVNIRKNWLDEKSFEAPNRYE